MTQGPVGIQPLLTHGATAEPVVTIDADMPHDAHTTPDPRAPAPAVAPDHGAATRETFGTLGAHTAPARVTVPTVALFDLDGTLVLSEARHRAIWATWFAERGLEFTEELARGLIGRRGRDTLAEFHHLFQGMTAQQVAAELFRIAERTDLPPITPAPGAAEYVRALAAAGVPVGLVTSAHRGHVEEQLATLGLTGVFDVEVTAEDVTEGKPHPEGYLRACAALGVEPSAAVGFEDSTAGVAAVLAAGMRCVAVATTLAPEALRDAHLVVPNLEGLTWPPPFANG